MFGFLGPLILWLVKKDESPAVDAHGKEALNFHLSFLLYYFACAILMIPVVFLTFGFGAIPLMPLFFLLIIGHLVCCILGAVQASEGRLFRYPLAIRFIS